MGTYINRGNLEFAEYISSDYVDKTELIGVINRRLFNQGRYSCVTRCRRFGKSMAAKMLYAYYDKSCDSRALFIDLKIADDNTFDKHLNKYNVLFLDVTSFTSQPKYHGHIVKSIQSAIIEEVRSVFHTVAYKEDDDLMGCLQSVYRQTGERFFFIIDEWDAICREHRSEMDEYVMFLRRLFKTDDSDLVFAGAYITGILPIVKYKTESALNNFWEYSMVDPGELAPYFGFTRDEVETLCLQHGTAFDEMQKWYDGYQIGNEPCIFNPSSVMKAVIRKNFNSYWAATGSYDNVVTYIKMNYEGLKDDIIRMLAGDSCKVNTSKFKNDITSIQSKDDALTILIHLGYLAYNSISKTCYIPNKEVRDELINAVEATDWTNIIKVLSNSERLLEATIAGNAEIVAHAIDDAHSENTSILSYNDENSLSCVLSIAYIYAKNDYIIHRELPSGKGFADLVFIPRRNTDNPAMVIELKYDKDAIAAIDQIKQKNYPAKIAEYLTASKASQILLVGINYDKETKTHTCKIEVLQ
ncbi:MAG: AAA family ATPase [Bacteroidales bacterium]|nr:AAA family ATPase [Candidatus Liminaster caballi]